MNLYIRVDGNSQIGLGHLMRCFALAQMLQPDFSITFVCRFIPDKIKNDIKEVCFKLLEIENEADFLKLPTKNDIIILDGYHFDLSYQKSIKITESTLVCIDDLFDKEYVADLIINHAPNVYPDNYTTLVDTQFALGPEYALLRPLFLEQARNKKEIIEIETVFICFGGSDFKNLTTNTVKVITEFSVFKRIIVVTGIAFKHIDELKIAIDSDKRIEHFNGIDERKMLELMKVSDLAIVPSSGILNEVLSVGCRVVSGTYVENQKFIYEAYKNENCFYDAYDFESKGLNEAIEKAISMIPLNKNSIDGLSNERLLKIFKKIKMTKGMSLRLATIVDTEITFLWAKNPEIRRFSFNKKEILWEEHVAWFQSKINNPQSIYLIAEIENKSVGSIRFDIVEGSFIISYLIGSDYHGYGLGKEILKKGINFLKQFVSERRLSGNKIIGFVIKDNIPSLKAFRALGFLETEDKENSKFEISI
jgi:UDP-2,4-diacetamido-2,4,6-trideoxy-beta-L-altropyranose hydrolase